MNKAFSFRILSVVALLAASWARAASPASEESVGADACLACHESMAGFKDSPHGKAMPKAKKIDFQNTCEFCHGPGALHAGAGGDKRNPDFAKIRKPAKWSSAALNRFCLQCHEKSARTKWVGSIHETRDISCLACHSIHGAGKNPHLWIRPTIQELCFQCHRNNRAFRRLEPHAALEGAEMDCIACHNPHALAEDE